LKETVSRPEMTLLGFVHLSPNQPARQVSDAVESPSF